MRWVINGVDKTASLELSVNDILETTYSYADAIYTLSARPNSVDVSLDQLKGNVQAIKNWLSATTLLIPGQPLATAECQETIRYFDGRIRAVLYFGDSLAVRATYRKSTKITTIDGRQELQLNPWQFGRFYSTYHRFLIEIRDNP